MHNLIKHTHLFHQILDVLWAAALICLPFTSFPLLVNLTGALVTPLSAIPILLLILFWFIPYVLKRRSLPRETIPLVIFTLIALLACTLAFFLDIPGFKGRTIIDQELRALLTMAIGLAFYLTISTWPQNETRAQKTYQWLTVGGVIAILWALFQAYYIFMEAYTYPDWMQKIQELFVLQSPYFTARGRRVTGFTYEASWFAHQMVMLYIPLWLAATYQRTSAFKVRFWRITVENVLLVLGVGLFFLTSPRIGLISFLLISLFVFLKLNLAILRRLVTSISSRHWFQSSKAQVPLRITATVTATLLMLIIYTIMLVGAIYLAIQLDWRMELLLAKPPTWEDIKGVLTLRESVLLSISHRWAFLERMVYWLTGWHIFNDHPWLGVGLGNAGFFALDQTPSIGWASYEIKLILLHLSQFPNLKSFWMRLLAETGIVGFSTFVAWVVVLFQSARLTLHSRLPMLQVLALTGQLSLVAFIGEGFSIDSFAMPYLWVASGLVAASSLAYRKTISVKPL